MLSSSGCPRSSTIFCSLSTPLIKCSFLPLFLILLSHSAVWSHLFSRTQFKILCQLATGFYVRDSFHIQTLSIVRRSLTVLHLGNPEYVNFNPCFSDKTKACKKPGRIPEVYYRIPALRKHCVLLSVLIPSGGATESWGSESWTVSPGLTLAKKAVRKGNLHPGAVRPGHFPPRR